MADLADEALAEALVMQRIRRALGRARALEAGGMQPHDAIHQAVAEQLREIQAARAERESNDLPAV